MANSSNKKKKTQPNISIQHDPSQSPDSGHVLDLRSIVARQEVQKAREERIHRQQLLREQVAAEKQAKKESRSDRSAQHTQRPGWRRFWKRTQQDPTGTHLETVTELRTDPSAAAPEEKKDELHAAAPQEHPAHVLAELYRDEPLIAAHEQAKQTAPQPTVAMNTPTTPAPRKQKQRRTEKRVSLRITNSTKRSPQPKQKKPSTKKQKTATGWSTFWKRPLTTPELEKAQRARTLPQYGFSFSAIGRPLIGFVLVAAVVVGPISVSAALSNARELETAVTESAESAFTFMQEAGSSLQAFDFASAERSFTDAQQAFDDAQREVGSVNGLALAAAKLIPVQGEVVETGQRLLVAGEELAAAGQQLTAALQILNTVDVEQLSTDEEQRLTDILVVLHSALTPTVDHVAEANAQLEGVTIDVIPESKREFARLAQEVLPAVEWQLQEAQQMSEALLLLLGHEERKRYLILFQNNHEIRPTGGFIGSLALMDIEGGRVSGLDIPGGGVYDVSGQLAGSVQPPAPLHLVNNEWNLQDANWFYHFPASAEKTLWFYERSGGPTVDGVMTLTPAIIEGLLEVTGPIDMTDEFDVVIDAENFYQEVQVRAEEKFDETRESKRIIGELTPLLFDALFERASEPASLVQVLSLLQNSLQDKDILIYLTNPQDQRQISQLDWAGEVKQTDRDYLAVVHTNIAGGKTDGVIDNTITHHAEIQPDGSIIDTVTVRRVHKGDPDDELQGVNNTDYIRFYVPEGSQLLESDGFETPEPRLFFPTLGTAEPDADLHELSGEVLTNAQTGISTNNEFQKTVFGGWMQTPVGESSIATITYRLPFTINVHSLWNQTDRYSLLWQTQPGAWDTYVESTIDLPENMQISRLYPPDYDGSIETILENDLFAGMIIERAQR